MANGRGSLYVGDGALKGNHKNENSNSKQCIPAETDRMMQNEKFVTESDGFCLSPVVVCLFVFPVVLSV